MAAAAAATLTLVLTSCGGSRDGAQPGAGGQPAADGQPAAAQQPGAPAGRRTSAPDRATAVPPLCRPLRTTTTGRVTDPAMDELSGLAVARAHPGVLYAEEDSGNPAVVTALRRDGQVLGHITVTGAQNRDWEDIATLRTRARGAELLLLENGEPGGVRIIRVPEPDLDSDPGATPPAASQRLRFPDGPHDVEALLADPLRDEVVVVTKDLFGGRAYAARVGTRTTTLRRGPVIDLSLVTAGDVSADGRTVALRTYSTLVVWRRRGDESLLRTLARAGCRSPADVGAEGQGEALAVDAEGRAAITASEGRRPALHRYTVR